VFDQGVGDLFVVRVAGNVADTDEIASIEYAVGHLDTPILLVMGHTACGAVTAVASHADVHGHIPPLVDNIFPAVEKARAWDDKLTGGALVQAAIRTNVQQSIQDIVTRSPIVREKLVSGKLMIVGGVYDLAAGTIAWLDDPTRPEPDHSTTNAPVNPQAPVAKPH
jgi:carbonic anhydrase